MDPTDNAGRDRERRVRIGDAERDEVLNALQEHLAAGRLDVDEYEQRAERVVAARYAEDLAEALADLPPTQAEQQRRQADERRGADRPPHWQGRLPFPVPLMIGLAVLAVIALPGPPFLLFPVLWLLLLAGFARRRWARDTSWDVCTGRRVV
jgi:Domain of unknown function (DUF1707)